MFLRLLLFLALGYILYALFWKNSLRSTKTRQRSSSAPIEEMKKDEVCGTFVPESQALTCHHQGELRYFCSEECRDKYLKQKS